MTGLTAAPADQAARTRILEDLDTTLMVEAGAGSGKTTSLVGRMLAHVRRGTPVDRIAAVTFTRKAATELRERFEIELESRTRVALEERDEEARSRYVQARADLDRAFLGTIHSFCARLLREHPLEAGLDPAFEEVSEDQWPEIRQAFWARWLERCRRAGEPLLDELRAVGIDPRMLYQGFQAVVLYPDVEFAADKRPVPDIRACRRALESLMHRAHALAPGEPVENERNRLARTVRRLEFLRRTRDWSHTPSFCDVLASITRSGCEVVQKCWTDRAGAKELSADFVAFVDGEGAALLAAWREHRYAPVMTFLQKAAAEFERERLATGRLGFEDLLLGAARLLRDNAPARRTLGERYRYLLVDEFQDTDPVQAEVCFLLASDPVEGSDWRTVRPRAGSLFVVGDPKQSIYRFRRADIQIYELVKQRIEACGDVLELTRNFRSVDQVRAFVNDHFVHVFPPAATSQQAAFVPMVTARPGEGEDGVHRCRVTPAANNTEAIVAEDSERIASWIAQRIALREAVPADFLILTLRKNHLEPYARALGARNVPATLAGAGLPEELELGELLVVLRALADPANPVAVTAALEGMPFGCSHADLWAAREAGLDFSIAHRPAESDSPAGRALEQLYRWWIASQRNPVDVLLDRILDDTGLLAYAASLPLGESRAGTMLHLVERVRAVATRDGGTLASAITAIESVLASATTDAPLRPGRGDAVRVMNLHKAKGLEARIVVLAAPIGLKDHPITVHVQRSGGATAGGGLVVMHDKHSLAQPVGWADMEAAERALLDAERGRLLYVAATRAKRELVVTQLDFALKNGTAADRCMWAPFEPALATRPVRTMTVTDPPGRRALAATAAELAERADIARAAREHAARSGFTVEPVTRAAKADYVEARAYDMITPDERGLGPAWGRALHRAVEAMGRGRSGESLAGFVQALVRDERIAAADGEVELAAARVIAALGRIRGSSGWAAISADGAVEVPVMLVSREADADVVVEGVADAIARTEEGWCVLDWKTDAVGDGAWERRREGYERQVGRYAEILEALTGIPAAGSIERVSLREHP